MVDDDECLRTTMGEVLIDLGYEVIQAANGVEALDFFAVHQRRISLVFTDVMMPKMSGFDLARSIWMLEKQLPVIFVTGFSKSWVMPSDDLMQRSIVVRKPFIIEDMIHLIQRVAVPSHSL